MENKKKTYTAIDFASYYSGNMEAKEMHALEKAALEDPFLADALEGYAFTTSATEDVQHLKSAITDKTSRKKVFSIASVSQNAWWRVAAIFILVGIAGYFIFNRGMEEGKTLARQEVAKATYDDTMIDSKELALQKETKSLESPKSEENLQPIPSGIQQPVLGAQPKQTTPSAKSESKPTEVADMPAMAMVSPQREEVRFRATLPGNNDSGAISAFAMQTDKLNKGLLKERSDNNDKKTLKGKPAYAYTNERKLDSPGLLFRQGGDTNEARIFINALPSVKGKALAGRMSGVAINKTYFEIPQESILNPKEGLEDYQNYLAKNRNPVINQIDQPVHGKVRLQFNIDQSGKPIKISILESDCTDCEKQARDLLKNGPLWKGKLEEQGEITLIF